MKFRRDFGKLRDLIVSISGTQQDIANRETVLKTTDTPAKAHLLWYTYTLVRKRLKMRPEF